MSFVVPIIENILDVMNKYYFKNRKEVNNMNNKGFTVVELLASFTLTMVVVVFLFEIVLELKNVYVDMSLKTAILNKNSIVATTLHNYFGESVETSSISSPNNSIKVGDTTITMPDKTTIEGFNVNSDCPDYVISTNNCYVKVSYTVKSAYLEKDIPFNYIHTYNS